MLPKLMETSAAAAISSAPANPPTRFLRIPEAQLRLGVGRSTFYDLLAKGALKAIKIGRRTLISEQELQRFMSTLEAR